MNTCVNTAPVHQSASDYTWPNRNGAAPVVTGVLKIAGMPRSLRPEVERAMEQCIRTESEFIVPGDDLLTAQWCTRWYRDEISMEVLVYGADAGIGAKSVGIGCRQVLTGTEVELAALDSAVSYLAQRYGFSASVCSS